MAAEWSGAAGFDRLTPVYDLLAGIAFFGAIGRCRRDLLSHLPAQASRILVIGGGTGGCARELAQRYPDAELVLLDWSQKMLDASRRQLGECAAARCRFVCCDLRNVELPQADLIAAHCVLDCFDAQELPAVVARLHAALTPGGHLHWSDFQRPASGAWGTAGGVVIRVTYGFFQLVGALRHHQLTPADPILSARGFVKKVQAERLGGLLASAIYTV